MARYDSEWDNQNQMNMNRSRDLVLSMNEFCFLQSKTNGAIKVYTGPTTMTISAQESLVTFNGKNKSSKRHRILKKQDSFLYLLLKVGILF